jgi:hypothetical protein
VHGGTLLEVRVHAGHQIIQHLLNQDSLSRNGRPGDSGAPIA